jgi:MFS family permease
MQQFARYVAMAIGGSDKSIWLSQAIVITTVVLGPPVSQASDYWGRKWFLVVGSVSGAVGALILARANSMGQAIGGQVISSVLYIGQPLLIAVGSEILPRRLRPSAQAGLNAAGGAGAIAGLLGGSALMANNPFGFRNYWYINTALMGASAVTLAVLYNPPPRPTQVGVTTRQKLGRLDWTGYALLAASLVVFTMGLTWGNNPFSWTNVHVLAPTIIGVVFFLVFIAHQTFFKKDGLIHHDLFKKDRNLALALGCFLADGVVFWAANNYYTMEIGIIYESDSVLAGLHYCITFFAGIGASITIYFASKYTKRLREPIAISFVLFMLFFGS